MYWLEGVLQLIKPERLKLSLSYYFGDTPTHGSSGSPDTLPPAHLFGFAASPVHVNDEFY